MALFNYQPSLPGMGNTGGLNQNVKKVSPDGTIEFHDDTNLLLGGLGGGYKVPPGGQINQNPANPPASTPENNPQSSGLNQYFDSDQGQMLALLLGQLGQGLAIPGSAQAGAGAVGAQFFQNKFFNRLLQGVLGGGESPFVSSSAAIGPGVAGLTPEMQTSILRSSQNQQQIPSQNFLRTAQGVAALRPETGTQANLQRVTSSLPPGPDGLPDPNGKVDPRKEYIYGIDPKTNQVGKYITTQVKPSPQPSSSVADKLGKTDVNYNLSQQFFEVAKNNLETKVGLERATAIIDAIGKDENGNINATRLLPHLEENEKLLFLGSLWDMAPETKNETDTRKQVKRLANQYKITINGLRYIGGSPNDPDSWKKVGK